jgi:hypothetical protein
LTLINLYHFAWSAAINGYILQATQKPKANSRNAKNARIPAIAYAAVLNCKKLNTTIAMAITAPIRAANCFGPAFIARKLIFSLFTDNSLKYLIILYLPIKKTA